jgi:two-component system response regulator YesN
MNLTTKEVHSMYNTLIVEPHDFSLNMLLSLPIWGDIDGDDNGFVCSKVATNGQEAIDILNTEKFDLVLTEINLPICDGLQLLKKIHKDNQPPLVVFISENISFSYTREGFIYGAFDYLPKPVSVEDMRALFKRAAKELKKYTIYFPPEKINNIVNGVIHQKQEVIEEFGDMLDDLYRDIAGTKQPDFVANRFYTAVIEGVYKANSWISLYLPQDFHRQIDYLVLHDLNDYIAYYKKNFSYLYELIALLNPMFQDETLARVYLYMLQNPEEDLKLTSVAKKFYLNHTYLSNLFSQKSNVRYSQLVTLIKLKRAEFLIRYTSLPLIDIAEQVGYKDFHYFCRLYKNTIGKSPTEYVRGDDGGWNYSI